ncbi:MAG: Flagellum site-determining protein YlxH [Planctomycetota bacterium]|jgi:flagellar biosynthesis protein FlhG
MHDVSGIEQFPGSSGEATLSSDQAERLRRLVAAPRSTQQSDPMSTAHAMSVSPEKARERVRPVRLARAIAVSSGKGGVGKTNLAVNLAVSYAEMGQRVVLLDADLGLANADVLCGITPRATLEDVVTGDRTLEEVMVHAPGGFRLVPGASGVSRLADMGQLQRRSVLEQLMALERTTDVVIVDTGAGIGANSMAFAAAAHTIVVATTPEPTAIADAYGAIKTLAARGVRDGLQLVVNMAMSEDEGRAVHARMDRVARAFLSVRVDYAGSIPLDPAVPMSVRRREPVLVGAPQAPSSRAIRQLSRVLAGEGVPGGTESQRAGFLARLVGFLAHR